MSRNQIPLTRERSKTTVEGRLETVAEASPEACAGLATHFFSKVIGPEFDKLKALFSEIASFRMLSEPEKRRVPRSEMHEKAVILLDWPFVILNMLIPGAEAVRRHAGVLPEELAKLQSKLNDFPARFDVIRERFLSQPRGHRLYWSFESDLGPAIRGLESTATKFWRLAQRTYGLEALHHEQPNAA